MDHHNDIGTRGKLFHGVLLGVVCISSVLLLPSCSLFKPRVQIVTVTETRDSIIIRERIVHDTAKVEIPVIVEKNVTKDDSSRLENLYAISVAQVKNGFLFHSLETKPQTIYVPVDVQVSDTTTVHEKEQETAKETVVTEYVEKELSWWQKFRLRAFWWLLGLSTALGVWTFRKPLRKLILHI